MSTLINHPAFDSIKPLPNCPDGAVANREIAIRTAITYQRFEGEWAEFGTWKGDTARIMLPYLPESGSLHLFDSYDGLSRDWGALPKGSFKTDPPVFNDPRVVMHNGWFEDTVSVLSDKTLSFIHIDCDLYESTLDVLWQLPPLRAGTIILFDEYAHTLGGKPVDDEHRAFTEWIADSGYRFRYLWRTAWTQVCVEIL